MFSLDVNLSSKWNVDSSAATSRDTAANSLPAPAEVDVEETAFAGAED